MCKDARSVGSRDRRAYRSGPLPGRLAVFALALIASGCALQDVVQRQSVEYNTAAGMANQLALLNIVRAEEHLPIFYTSIAASAEAPW
jgi:hypothetical protein